MEKGSQEQFEFSFNEMNGYDHASIGLKWLGDFQNGRYEDDTQTRLGYFLAHSRRGFTLTGSHNIIEDVCPHVSTTVSFGIDDKEAFV